MRDEKQETFIAKFSVIAKAQTKANKPIPNKGLKQSPEPMKSV